MNYKIYLSKRLNEDETSLVPSKGRQIVKGNMKDELYSIFEIMLSDDEFQKIIEWYSKNDTDAFPFLVQDKEDFIKKFRMLRNSVLNAIRKEGGINLSSLGVGSSY